MLQTPFPAPQPMYSKLVSDGYDRHGHTWDSLRNRLWDYGMSTRDRVRGTGFLRRTREGGLGRVERQCQLTAEREASASFTGGSGARRPFRVWLTGDNGALPCFLPHALVSRNGQHPRKVYICSQARWHPMRAIPRNMRATNTVVLAFYLTGNLGGVQESQKWASLII